MKRIVVTGATSFIGKPLCLELCKMNEVIAVVRPGSLKANLFLENNIEVIECEFSEYSQLPELVKNNIDCGVLLTWDGTRGVKRNDGKLQSTNFKNSIIGLNSLIELGAKCILTAGSQAEYGPLTKSVKISEIDECKPNTEYGKFKLNFYKQAKEICFSKGLRLIEPRFFSLYGPDDSEETMIISMLKQMIKGHPCDLTECVQLWDFLYIDDAIRGLVKMIERGGTEGVYNFGTGYSQPLKNYIETMHKLTKSKSNLNYGALNYPVTGMVNANPCVDKLKSEIGWKPEITFEEGIERVIAHLVLRDST